MRSKKKGRTRPWGGRFARPTDELFESFSASVQFDSKLYPYDIAGSIAHAEMLGRQGLVTKAEARALVKGLREIKAEIEAGQFTWEAGLEDVHMNIEQALVARLGPVGEKLHTGRSRNDQVALDLRMYVRDAAGLIQGGLRDLRLALVRQGLAHPEVALPGYTHLQRAQPVLLAHHLLAYNEMLKRDQGRLADLSRRVKVMPLGSAALAGTGLGLDPASVARDLGFDRVAANSLDAVSDRDFVLEFLSAAAILMMHLSRLSEELILWASAEFGFVDLPEELCTGSSIMPQKKNPDVPELVRGKTGRVYGHLLGLLTVLKGLPLAYNRDLQEDKEPLFDTVETLAQVLPLTTRLVEGLSFKAEKMQAAAQDPFLLATDLADHLVRRGVPFRQAHALVGRAVRHCLQEGLSLTDLDQARLAELCPGVGPGVKKDLTLAASLKAKTSPGGTAPRRVKTALKRALRELEPPARKKSKK